MKKTQQPQIIPTMGISPIDQKDLPKYLAKSKAVDEIKIVYFGTPEFSAYILEKLLEFCQNPFSNLASHIGSGNVDLPKQFSIQTVITGPHPSPVSLVAEKYQIPTLKPAKLDDDFSKYHQSFLESDLFIVASYGKIIPKDMLEIPKYGSINVHGSILPKYRGASPMQQALLNGDKKTGITITLMDEEMDHGPILITKEINISDQDNLQTLSNKMREAGAKLLIETFLKFIEGKVIPTPQDHSKATYCSRLTKESGYFDINTPPDPQILDRMIRAYFPWPGVWIRWNGKIVKFLPDGLLQMEGKKAISKKDFLNGYPDFPLLLAAVV